MPPALVSAHTRNTSASSLDKKQSIPATCLVSAAEDGTVILWDARTLTALRALRGLGGAISSLKVMGAGELWCGQDNGDITVAKLEDGFTKHTTLSGHDRFVSGMGVMSSTEQRITWSYSLGDNKIVVWRQTCEGRLPGEVTEVEGMVEDLSMRLEAEQLKAASADAQRRAHEDRVADLEAALAARTKELADTRSELADANGALKEQQDALRELQSNTSTNSSITALLRATVAQRECVVVCTSSVLCGTVAL